MPLEPFTAGPRPCSACGQRPASVRLQIQRGGQRGDLALCEPCALRLAERRGGMPAPQDRAEHDPQSPTPALDDLGRDLTAFFTDAATAEIYALSLHVALPI